MIADFNAKSKQWYKIDKIGFEDSQRNFYCQSLVYCK